ncbi:hypothetical protein BJ508DRAFT_416052 [Ascobolus immersus RN42]|uniref:Uncharacterized protein n=1 Tax=Ascobolus immersus RN42 TaxID=1160509 RepID=A0A3N4HZI4_ASCIM|nr:hypothetical protein BJ508DRAFT_416052 [Ascobolus immersus RN42]
MSSGLSNVTQTTVGNTITTSGIFAYPPKSIISMLHDPNHYFTLSPYMKSLKVITPLQEYECIEEIPFEFLGFKMTTKTTLHVKCQQRDDGISSEVYATSLFGLLSTTTRSTFVVSNPGGQGGPRVDDIFELVKAPWGLGNYVLKTAADGHLKGLEVLEDKLLQVSAGF